MLLRDFLAHSSSGVEGGFQRPQVFVPHDPLEAFLCSEESRSHPAQNHLAILSVGDPPGLDAHSGVRAFDDVGSDQAAVQGGMSNRLMVKHSSRPSS